MTVSCSQTILAIRNGFIRGHYGKVATKAPPDRVMVHQRKLRSIFHTGQFLTSLSIFDSRTATVLL